MREGNRQEIDMMTTTTRIGISWPKAQQEGRVLDSATDAAGREKKARSASLAWEFRARARQEKDGPIDGTATGV